MSRDIAIILLVFGVIAPFASPQETSGALLMRWGQPVGGPSEMIIEQAHLTQVFTGGIKFIGVGDVNQDGEKEVLVATGGSVVTGRYEINNVVYAYRRNGTLMWKNGIDDLLITTFMTDIDRDGNVEMIVSSGRYIEEISRGMISVIGSNGKTLRTFRTSGVMDSIYVADLDNDRYYEIIGGSRNNVRVFDSFGTERWFYRTYESVSFVHADNIVGTSNPEIFAGSDNLYLFWNNGTLLNGLKVSSITNKTADSVDMIVIGNVTLERGREFVLTTKRSDMMYVMAPRYNSSTKDYDIIQRWVYPVGRKLTSIILANVDDDINDEILFGSSDKTLNVVDNDGSLIWTYSLDGNVMDIKVADVNGDGLGEVIAGTTGGSVFAFSMEDGEFRWRFDLDEEVTNLEVEDLEDDGFKEVVIGTLQQNIYVYEINQSFTERGMADSYYSKAQQMYVSEDYNESLLYLEKAKTIYMGLGEVSEVDRVNSLITTIRERLTRMRMSQADTYYDKAQESFIDGNYEEARDFAESAKRIYEEFEDTKNVLKCELLLKRISNVMSGVTTLISSTTLPGGEKTPSAARSVGQFVAVLVVLVFLFMLVRFLKGRRERAKALDKSYDKYEESLEKVLEEK